MKNKLSLRNSQKQKMSMRRRMLLIAGAASITGLIVALVFLFNIGNVRDAFAASTTYYSIASGAWENKATWSTDGHNGRAASSYPQDGDIVYINGHTVTISMSDVKAKNIHLNQDNQAPTILDIKGGRTVTVSDNILLASNNQDTEVSMNISGTRTKVLVGGNLFLDKNKGGQGNLNLLLSGTAVLNVAGNLISTFDNGQNNVNIQLAENSSMNVAGNIELNHVMGNGTIYLAAKDNASVTVENDLVFDNDKKSGAIIQLNSTAKLNIGGSIIKEDDNQQYGAMLAMDNSTINFFGDGQQTIGGYAGTGSDTFVVNTLIINNSTPTVPQIKMSGHVKVTGQLILKDGIAETNTSAMIIVADNAVTSGGSDSSYVSGPMQKDGNDAFIFPVGKNNKIAQIGISAPSTSTSFVAQYFKSAYTSPLAIDPALTKISNKEYWQLNRTKGTGTSSVQLFWNDAAYSEITNPSDVKVARVDAVSRKWKESGNTLKMQSPTSGSVASTSTNDFGTFTFGFVPSTALPVSLISFDAIAKNGSVQLNWSTASEENNDFFTIERSQDGKTFEKVATVKGNGTTQQMNKYGYTDAQPLPGVSYYRLKQTDFNGQFEYFKIKSVNIPNAQIQNVGPNPFTDNITVQYNMLKESKVEIQLVSASGNVVYETSTNGNKGNNTFTIRNQQQLSKGVYILRLISEGLPVNYKLVKG